MNKKRVLFTGGTGFIGQNVLPFLREKYEVFAPRRSELNLLSVDDVRAFIIDNKIDIVVHTANPCPSKNQLDSDDIMLKNSLCMFLSFYNNRDLLEKFIFIGSGGAYGKQDDIVSITEESIGKRVPLDDYGIAKQIMQLMAKGNVYGLGVFGCYGPGDADSKFITHAIRCCIDNRDISIRQDCNFDYLHVFDLAKIMIWMIDNKVKHNYYHACSGKKYLLSYLAEEVKKQMDANVSIVLKKEGYNKEYTGDNHRLLLEYKEPLIDIEKGISMQIQWEKEHYIPGSHND